MILLHSSIGFPEEPNRDIIIIISVNGPYLILNYIVQAQQLNGQALFYTATFVKQALTPPKLELFLIHFNISSPWYIVGIP